MPHFFLGLIKCTVSFSIFLGGCTPGETMFADYPTAAAESDDPTVTALVKEHAHPLTGRPNDYDALIEMIGDNRFVMLGEATHGTHEFYRERSKITQRLIKEKGFDAIVLEADWTDAFDVNRYVLGASKSRNAEAALSGFTRFPKWMWANTDFRDLVTNVRAINDARKGGEHKVGIYGMDLYGGDESAVELIRYLQKVDPPAGERASRRYSCFSGYKGGIEEYAATAGRDRKKSCEQQVADQFDEMEQRYRSWLARGTRERNDELFSAYQNARVVKNGEAYFRRGREPGFSSWNHRDMHMSETINALAEYFTAVGDGTSKIAVWAHNSHQGDALMTDMGEAGELNVGHLMRKAHDGKTVLVGFTTDRGRVMAARGWGIEGEVRELRPAIPGSYARIFTDTGIPDFMLIFRGNQPLSEAFSTERLQRAVGVVYMPQSERTSHYFGARISKQFDAVIHFTETDAVKPLSFARRIPRSE
jgi:erythromycin esterase-like protein